MLFKLAPSDDGTVFVFPVEQKCAGGSTVWNQTSAPGSAEPKFPAPTVTVYQNGTMEPAVTNGASVQSLRVGAFLVMLLMI